MSIFGGTISNLEQGLDFSTLRNKKRLRKILQMSTRQIIKRKDVSFNEYLTDAKKILYQHIELQKNISILKRKLVHLGISSYNNLSYRHNGNGVDMDKEQANLAKPNTTIMH